MNKESEEVIYYTTPAVYKKIIIGLLIVIQGLGVYILNSVSNRIASLENVNISQSEEIETMQTDLAIMEHRLDDLQKQADSIESFLIGRPQLKKSMK